MGPDEARDLLAWAGSRPGVLKLLKALKEAFYDETGTEYLRRIVQGTGISGERMKWAGGKAGIMYQVTSHLPEKFRRYHEPFLGGGAMFFELVARYSAPGLFQAKLPAGSPLASCLSSLTRS